MKYHSSEKDMLKIHIHLMKNLELIYFHMTFSPSTLDLRENIAAPH